jgi:hypothetical protein
MHSIPAPPASTTVDDVRAAAQITRKLVEIGGKIGYDQETVREYLAAFDARLESQIQEGAAEPRDLALSTYQATSRDFKASYDGTPAVFAEPAFAQSVAIIIDAILIRDMLNLEAPADSSRARAIIHALDWNKPLPR